MTRFLTVADVLEIHRHVIEATGGAGGVRDAGLLQSAVARPQATFGGEPLYPDRTRQAAALVQSLTANHPFVDGNKRTAFTAMDVFLRCNGAALAATEDEKYAFMIGVATAALDFEAIVAWLAAHVRDTAS